MTKDVMHINNIVIHFKKLSNLIYLIYTYAYIFFLAKKYMYKKNFTSIFLYSLFLVL